MYAIRAGDMATKGSTDQPQTFYLRGVNRINITETLANFRR